MIKYIFNTDGDYVAFLVNQKYCFSSKNDYIGFMKGIYLFDYSGKYLGTLTSDDRIIRNKNEKINNIIPISKPLKPLIPLRPLKRYRMPPLSSSYIDIFSGINGIVVSEENNKDFSKYINCYLYSYNNKFLGILSLNKYDKDSLANKYGTYGSQYSSDSIFNKYGTYGSQYNSLSPFNKYSNQYAILKDKNGKEIARVSDNDYIGGNVINATELFNWYQSKIK